MAGQKIDRGSISFIYAVIQVRGTDHPLRRLRCCPEVALEEIPHAVAVLAVPFRPAVVGRKASDLIHAARVPGFRNQLDVAEDRIVGHSLQKRRIFHWFSVAVSPQNAGQVKTEAVHMIAGHPVAQTVDNILLYDRMIAIQRIAAAGEIIVLAVRRQHIPDIIVQTTERNKRSALVSFRRMVEYDIQNYLDSVLLQELNHFLEFPALTVILRRRRVAGIRCEKRDRIIPPVLIEAFPVILMTVVDFIELENRHQFNCCNAEPAKIRNLLNDTGKSSGISDSGRRILCESAHMHFVNDGIFHRRIRKMRGIPAEIVLDHPRSVRAVVRTAPFLLCAPFALSYHRLGVRVQKLFRFIEKKSPSGIIRSVNAVRVLKFLDVESEDNDRPHLPDSVGRRNRDHAERLCGFSVIQNQLAGCRVTGINCKVYAARNLHGAVLQIIAGPYLKSADFIRRRQCRRNFQIGCLLFIRKAPPHGVFDCLVPVRYAFPDQLVYHVVQLHRSSPIKSISKCFHS